MNVAVEPSDLGATIKNVSLLSLEFLIIGNLVVFIWAVVSLFKARREMSETLIKSRRRMVVVFGIITLVLILAWLVIRFSGIINANIKY